MDKSESYTDLQLLTSLQVGDQAAFKAIFNRYKAVLYNFAYYKIKDKEQARDLIQSVFMQLWEYHDTIIVKGSFESYIFTLVRNKIIDHFRSVQVSQRYIDTFQIYLDDTENNTDYLIREKMMSELIAEAIADLPENLRIVFELSRDNLLTRKQIAEHVGLSEEGVKTRIHRALKILKGKLGTGVYYI